MDYEELKKKKRTKKIVAGFLILGIAIVLFFLGMFSTNIVMKLVVDHGNEAIVPNLVGMNFPKAADVCKENKLYIQDISREYSDVYPVGHIIEQEPVDSSIVKRFRTINVVLSKGIKMIKMPLLIGTDLELVKNQMEILGLKIGKISKYYNQEIRKDVVISTVPAAGEDVSLGGSVDLDVSLGNLSGKDDFEQPRGSSSGQGQGNDEEAINYEDLFQ